MLFFEILQALCHSKQITPTEMARKIGISTAMPTNWKKGQVPNGETLMKLSDFFNVSVDYLLGRENKSEEIILTYGNSKKDELKKKIDSINLPDEKIDLLLNMIDSWI